MEKFIPKIVLHPRKNLPRLTKQLIQATKKKVLSKKAKQTGLRADYEKYIQEDGISARMLRQTAKSIAPSITNIINLSLKTGSFTTLWKTSHAVPIPKSENRTSPSNYIYRPISLLSILSKVLERHVHGLITEHLSLTHPLAINQWGFRARRSSYNISAT